MSNDAPASAATGRSETASARQFVTFHVARETYAVPLAEVQEIIRLPDMVDVPLAPPALAGLANLRGSVLPVASLRRLFELPDRVHDDATRVVVVGQGAGQGGGAGGTSGFVVDRMASVITAEPGEIEGTDGLTATAATELLAGVIKRPAGIVLIIDLGRLLQRSGSGRAGAEGGLGGSGGRNAVGPIEAGGAASARPEGEAGLSDEIQLVSFELAGQEYALPIEQVQEIVQVPDRVSELPKAERHVIGVINLRDRLLPLVSLRALFGLPGVPLGEQNRIVVVASRESAGSVGIVTDTVKEVLRVPRAVVDPLPDLLTQGDALREVEAICRLGGGKRLVSILSAARLFATTGIAGGLAGLGAAEEGPVQERQTATAPTRADEEEQFVVFRLADEEYGVPIDAVHEIVRVPEQLTHVPRTPGFIEGIVNLRGAVLPVVDQRRRFRLPEAARNDRQRIMVFVIAGVRTGFIVDSVSEVLKIPRSAIVSAPDLAQDDDSAVERVANLAAAKRIILMVNVDRLLSRHEVADLQAA
ncbi:chemotaxis protein CheW [Methylobacterium sp. Leaf361]|uniref:chemotaxis protein CheW n=1 Tax=Methylobacterium sp. Leaf361 TaxID=1736352 RepID=UPI0006F3F139|nr:chemotaxis protein CheW [Methylobacterium sp. Leaf361]KQS80054.1 chemotaxis protein CheW [Methylobacterium sp. Leaf361]